jgi:oligosaccharide reducing-end xylanase
MRMERAISSILICLFILFSSLSISHCTGEPLPFDPDPIGSVTAKICTWRDDHDGALSITFDDGLSSHFNLAGPLLDHHQLKGTFFVTLDNVGIPYGANWSDWADLWRDGHEIGSHSISHPDLTTLNSSSLYEEVVLSGQRIEENISGSRCVSFSYPMGRYNDTVLSLVRENYLGARMDRHNVSGPPGPNPKDPMNIHSVIPVNFGRGDLAAELNEVLNLTIFRGGWMVEMIHAIGSDGYDPVDPLEFESHLARIELMQDSLWTDTFGNVTKYILERQNTRLSNIVQDNDSVHFGPISHLDPEIFDVPLTVELEFPSDWIDVDVHIGNTVKNMFTDDKGDGRALLLDIALDDTVSVFKNNSHPFFYGEGSGPNFSPQTGTTGTLFEFEIMLSSKRYLSSGPYIYFDLNYDGDSLDVVGNMSEGPHTLITYGISGMDNYKFGFSTNFPPGVERVWYHFDCIDEEGLYTRYPVNGRLWGPFVNDPPLRPIGFNVSNLHSTEVLISWDPPVDIDGDMVTTELIVQKKGYPDIRFEERRIVDTMHKIHWSDLGRKPPGFEIDGWFGSEFLVEARFIDEHNSYSLPYFFNFTPHNAFPGDLHIISVEGLNSSEPVIYFDPVSDPDGDQVHYLTEVYEMDAVFDHRTEMVYSSSSYELNHPIKTNRLEENVRYQAEVIPIDELGFQGGGDIIDFILDPPPYKITNLLIKEDPNGEGSVIASWDPVERWDIVSYEVLVYSDDPFEKTDRSDFLELSRSFNASAQTIVDGLTDERMYWFTIRAWDEAGQVGPESKSVPFSTRDNKAPDKVEDLDCTVIPEPLAVELTWSQPISHDILGYQVFRSSGFRPNTPSDLIQLVDINPGKDSIMSFRDATVRPNITYHYSIAAYDEVGNRDLLNLSWISVTIFFPDPPDNSSGETSSDDIVEDASNDQEDGLPAGPVIIVLVLMTIVIAFIVSWIFFLIRRRDEFEQ